jgi:hypothetical protein
MIFAEHTGALGAEPSVNDLAPGEGYEKVEGGVHYYCVRTVDDTGAPTVRCAPLPPSKSKSIWTIIGAAGIAAGALIALAVAATRE